MRVLTAAVVALVLSAPRLAAAYPEYQKWVQKESGRSVSCAMCHAHPDGPEGVKHGQIGSLTPAEFEALGRARIAFEPGQKIDSPILNAFGNRIIEAAGKKKFMALRDRPEDLGKLLGDSDLDGDGLSDAREYRDGTDVLNPHHGAPWALLAINLRRFGVHLGLLVLATMAGLYGLNHLFRWFGTAAEAALRDRPAVEDRDHD